MKLKLYSLTEKPTTVTVPEEVFGAAVNLPLIAQAVHVYRSNQRQGGAKAKARGDVNLTTKKMYKQKGTGNARHGAFSAPQFVGGGVAHGPTGMENWKRSLTPVLARKALVSALSSLAADKKVSVVADLDKLDGKTKTAAKFLTEVREKAGEKILVVVDASHTNVIRSLRNLENVRITSARRLNTLEAVSSAQLIVMQPALELLAGRLAPKKETK
jgi:large subunit ribosomal protein L4